jgi:acetyl esterase
MQGLPCDILGKDPLMHLNRLSQNTFVVKVSFAATVTTVLAASGKPLTPVLTSPLRSTILQGRVANAPSKGVTLVINRERQATTLDAGGVFRFALELGDPAYVDLEIESQKERPLGIILLPGQNLSVDCDVAKLDSPPRFRGGGAAENDTLTLLQQRYDQIDYRQLFTSGPASFQNALLSHQRELQAILAKRAGRKPPLDMRFVRLERARILYWGAWGRITRMGLSGDWATFASNLDFNDPSLLGVTSYADFLRKYVVIRAQARLASDPALGNSINQQTEARYAVAIETFVDPVVRSAQIYEVLRNHFSDRNDDDGPYGCKGIESVMTRFDVDCTNTTLRDDIDHRYRQCLDGRNAPLIRPYKNVGTISLDAHIFPARDAKPGEQRPAFLFFHGGGWESGMPEWGYDRCKRYAERGMVGISFEYRLWGRHGTTPFDAVADAKSAVRWARTHAAELGIDPDRIVVAGFSAGGHLAAATGIVPGLDDAGDDKTVSAMPMAMILMSAVVEEEENGWFQERLAGRGKVADGMPARHVGSGLPAAIVFHGRKDRLCPFAATEDFCRRMKAAGNRCELHEFDGGHFRSRGEWATIDEETDKFLESLGLLQRTRP